MRSSVCKIPPNDGLAIADAYHMSPHKTMTIGLRLAILGCALLAQRAAAAEGFEPLGATIAQLRAALDAGQISSEQLTRYYLDRIQRFDQKGPHINALITINAKAVQQAKQL